MTTELDEKLAIQLVAAIDWDLWFENAATAAQHSPICDDPVVRQAIMDNIVTPALKTVAYINEVAQVDKRDEGAEGD